MKQEVLFRDVLPYIEAWTLVIAIVMLVFIYNIWRFGRKHPEIFKKDDKSENLQVLDHRAELRRQYHNKSVWAMLLTSVWMLGMMAIFLWFDSSSPNVQSWFLQVFALVFIVWFLLQIQRKR